MAEDPFPNWSQTPNKGDVIRAMVYARAPAGKLAAALGAIVRGDMLEARVKIEEYYEADAVLNQVIYEIGGKPSDE